MAGKALCTWQTASTAADQEGRVLIHNDEFFAAGADFLSCHI